MAVSMSMFAGIDDNEYLEIRPDGVVSVNVEYSVPGRVRNSVTNILLRAVPQENPTSTLSREFNIGGFGYGGVTETQPIRPILIKARVFGSLFHDRVISKMAGCQSSNVVYRKVEIETSKAFVWEDDQVQSTTGGAPSQFSRETVYRYKTGAITGTNDKQVEDHKALVLLLYPTGQSAAYNKPSRFIVSGVTFGTFREAAASADVGALFDFFSNKITLSRGSGDNLIEVTFQPVVKVSGEYRQIAVVQIEGISNVAGSKADR